MAARTVGGASGGRRTYSVAEKHRIIEETLQPGASVSVIARRHDINANLVFTWRKRHLRAAAVTGPALLPVEITTTAAPPKSEAPRSRARTARKGRIEITLANGHRVEVVGAVDVVVLRQVVETLSR